MGVDFFMSARFLWNLLLCAPSVFFVSRWLNTSQGRSTTETQRTQRLHREEPDYFIPGPLSPSEQSPIAKPSPIANPSPIAKPSPIANPSPIAKPSPSRSTLARTYEPLNKVEPSLF